MDVLQQIKQNIASQQLFGPTDVVVVAASAGVDSQVLLQLLAQLPERPRVIVAHVDHQLRPSGAAEATFVQRIAQGYGFEYQGEVWPIEQHPAQGLELAGRDFRYVFFATVAKQVGATKVLTAHHANDQAETLLMKLTRGGDWQQLSGIAWQRPLNTQVTVVRPLLNVPKAALINYAQTHDITWMEDESNADLQFTRNRYRQQILPALTTENPRVVEHLANYAQQLTDVEQLLASQTQSYLAQMQATNDWRQVPKPWFKLVVQAWLQQAVPNVSVKQAHLAQLQQLFENEQKPTGSIQLNAQVVVVKAYHQLNIKRLQSSEISSEQFGQIMVTLNRWNLLSDGSQLALEPIATFAGEPQLNEQRFAVSLQASQLPLLIRGRQVGDRIAIKNGHQKVKQVLLDAKVPQPLRDSVPLVVTQQQEVLWILNHKQAWQSNETPNYRLKYIPANMQKPDRQH